MTNGKTEKEVLQLIFEVIIYYNSKRIYSNHKDKSSGEFLRNVRC